VVTSLTEYVTVDKQLLKDILEEVGKLRKLADTLLPDTTIVVEEEGEACSAEFVLEQKAHLQV
jgi:hypothetical protein